MGCGILFALVFPIWLLLAASALQLWPELRGEWVMDMDAGGRVMLREYGFFVQWFRGGAVAAAVLALASPLAGVVFLVSTGVDRIGRRQRQAEVARLDLEAGTVALDVPIVVRKRRKGVAEPALPVAIVDASPGRRLVAKAVDGAALLAASAGGAFLGGFGTVVTIDWGSLSWGWPAVGAALGAGAVSAVQWAGVLDRGQTFGKMLTDIREIEGDDRPPSAAALVRRHVVPGVVGLGLAGGLSVGVGLLVALGIERSGFADRFVMGAVSWVAGGVALPVLWAWLAALRGLPLLRGGEALHDRWASTRVVRTTLASEGA